MHKSGFLEWLSMNQGIFLRKFFGEGNKLLVMEWALKLNLGMKKSKKESRNKVLTGKKKVKGLLIWNLKLLRHITTEASLIGCTEKPKNVSLTFGCQNGHNQKIQVQEL